MGDKKMAALSEEAMKTVTGGVLEDYGKRYIDTLIQDIKGYEGMGPADLIRKIEQMPPTFFDRKIGDATMEEVSEYVYQNWDRF